MIGGLVDPSRKYVNSNKSPWFLNNNATSSYTSLMVLSHIKHYMGISGWTTYRIGMQVDYGRLSKGEFESIDEYNVVFDS